MTEKYSLTFWVKMFEFTGAVGLILTLTVLEVYSKSIWGIELQSSDQLLPVLNCDSIFLLARGGLFP